MPDSHLLPDSMVKELRRAYYAAVSYTDDNVGAFSRVKREPAEESAHESKTK